VNGLPSGARPQPTVSEFVLEDRLAARRSATDLRTAITIAGASLCLLIAAVGFIWFGP
jgi:hypothetical protein